MNTKKYLPHLIFFSFSFFCSFYLYGNDEPQKSEIYFFKDQLVKITGIYKIPFISLTEPPTYEEKKVVFFRDSEGKLHEENYDHFVKLFEERNGRFPDQYALLKKKQHWFMSNKGKERKEYYETQKIVEEYWRAHHERIRSLKESLGYCSFVVLKKDNIVVRMLRSPFISGGKYGWGYKYLHLKGDQVKNSFDEGSCYTQLKPQIGDIVLLAGGTPYEVIGMTAKSDYNEFEKRDREFLLKNPSTGSFLIEWKENCAKVVEHSKLHGFKQGDQIVVTNPENNEKIKAVISYIDEFGYISAKLKKTMQDGSEKSFYHRFPHFACEKVESLNVKTK